MHSDPIPNPTVPPVAESPTPERSRSNPKPPRTVLQQHDPTDSDRPQGIYAFAPNRDTLGGTAYLIVEEDNVLVDCPAWNSDTQAFLQQMGGVRWLVITHRGNIGKAREIQQCFGCQVVIQEQEAYLLPDLAIASFQQERTLTPHTSILWTPGHSPGSSCVYHDRFGGVLFTGRHLLPDPQGTLKPLRTAKTFHWTRQLSSVRRLQSRFNSTTLFAVCPGANIGFLRGKHLVEDAYLALSQLDLTDSTIVEQNL